MVDEDDRTVKEPPTMIPISRRGFLAAGLTLAGASATLAPLPDGPRSLDLH